MERENLKERHRGICERLVAKWNEWNAAMLPLGPDSFTWRVHRCPACRPFWRGGALNGKQTGSEPGPKKKEPVKHRLFDLCPCYP